MIPRQLHRPFRKPLVVMTPKSLLRHAQATSSREDFEERSFSAALDDPRVASGEIERGGLRRLLICSGKVYYTLDAARVESGFDDVGIVRLEQLHPFPFEELGELLGRYPVRDFAWVQEEPWNQGGWSYVHDRVRRVLPRAARFRYVGRPESASVATGSFRRHTEEESDVVREAFAKRRRRRR